MRALTSRARLGNEARPPFLGKLADFVSAVAVPPGNSYSVVADYGAKNERQWFGYDPEYAQPQGHDRSRRGDPKVKGPNGVRSFDHAAGAKDVGMPLAPTLLLIFGNAKGGTPLMQAKQQVGIDLPLKVLAWQDSGGRIWLSYNDPHWIAQRHGLGYEVDPTVNALSGALAAISKEATT